MFHGRPLWSIFETRLDLQIPLAMSEIHQDMSGSTLIQISLNILSQMSMQDVRSSIFSRFIRSFLLFSYFSMIWNILYWCCSAITSFNSIFKVFSQRHVIIQEHIFAPNNIDTTNIERKVKIATKHYIPFIWLLRWERIMYAIIIPMDWKITRHLLQSLGRNTIHSSRRNLYPLSHKKRQSVFRFFAVLVSSNLKFIPQMQ